MYEASENVACIQAKRATLELVGAPISTCDECPFPFPVCEESCDPRECGMRDKAQLIHSYGGRYSVPTIAYLTGAQKRTIYRVLEGINSQCSWCRLLFTKENVLCRSNICTVFKMDVSDLEVVFHTHKHAEHGQVRSITFMMDNLFPDSILTRQNGCDHDHWSVCDVGQEDIDKAFAKMSILKKYANVV